jgi:hypothetical protein
MKTAFLLVLSAITLVLSACDGPPAPVHYSIGPGTIQSATYYYDNPSGFTYEQDGQLRYIGLCAYAQHQTVWYPLAFKKITLSINPGAGCSNVLEVLR